MNMTGNLVFAAQGAMTPAEMAGHAEQATRLLKAIASPKRLMLLCMLTDTEQSVSSLAKMLDLRQATVSQHLARLRLENIVTTRRVGQTVLYSIADETTAQIIEVLCQNLAPEKTVRPS